MGYTTSWTGKDGRKTVGSNVIRETVDAPEEYRMAVLHTQDDVYMARQILMRSEDDDPPLDAVLRVAEMIQRKALAREWSEFLDALAERFTDALENR